MKNKDDGEKGKAYERLLIFADQRLSQPAYWQGERQVAERVRRLREFQGLKQEATGDLLREQEHQLDSETLTAQLDAWRHSLSETEEVLRQIKQSREKARAKAAAENYN